MAIIRVAIGDILEEFKKDGELDNVWSFIHKHMAASDVERAIVLMDDQGATIGEIWDRSLYFAHWETPSKMRAYLDLAGFDRND
jgi:hypothetical protein